MNTILAVGKSIVIIVAVGAVISNATFAAFDNRGSVNGNVFAVGAAHLQLLQNVAGPFNNSNYADQISGTSFDKIYPGWKKRYSLKLVNTGSVNLTVNSRAAFVSGDSTLGDHIKVTIRAWNDGNRDGVVQPSEATGPYGITTLTNWQETLFTTAGGKNPFGDLGQINTPDPVRGFVIDFEAPETMPDSAQGKRLTLDFIFGGTTAGAPQ